MGGRRPQARRDYSKGLVPISCAPTLSSEVLVYPEVKVEGQLGGVSQLGPGEGGTCPGVTCSAKFMCWQLNPQVHVYVEMGLWGIIGVR